MSWLTDPQKFMKFNLWMVGLWLVSIPVSYVLGWLGIVEYVSALSLYAIVIAHLSTYAAARTEVLQSDADKKIQEDNQRLKKLDPDHPRQQVD